MAVINYEIFQAVGKLSEEDKDGKSKQLTCTSWGRYNPKFDIRAWDSEYTSMSKGVTLTLEEAKALKELLNAVDLDAIMDASLKEREANKGKDESVVAETKKSTTKTTAKKAISKTTTAKKATAKRTTKKATTTKKARAKASTKTSTKA